jgi:ATP-dependent DNA helicase RecQ
MVHTLSCLEAYFDRRVCKEGNAFRFIQLNDIVGSSLMHPEAAFYGKAGYYLEYLQQLRPELENASGLDIKWMINRLCSFLVRGLNFENIRKYAPTESWKQILSVYHNLLIRGIPTYPTLQLEKFLLHSASKVVPVEERDDNRSIAFRDKFPSFLKNTWLKVLAQAHVAVDHQCTSPPAVMDSSEEKEFMEALSKELGPSVFQLFECQRPFHSLVNIDDAKSFYDQRVDFSLETKHTRMVVEIDGKQHEEQTQKLLDERRDRFLKADGWEVIRIPASNVRQKQIESQLQNIKEKVLSDPFVAAAIRSFQEPFDAEEAGQAALQMVLVPFAVARIQLALVWAFMNGYLNIRERALRIAVVEKDLPCAFPAFWDFMKSLSHLKTLAGIKQDLPTIKLEIFRNFDSGFDDGTRSLEADPRLSTSVFTAKELERLRKERFDMIISISTFRANRGDGDQAIGRNPCIEINSVHSPRGTYPQIESAHPIEYRLGQEPSESVIFLLHWIFRKREFLEGQFEILRRSLALKDMIGLLPTSGGKSLCYQLSALLQPGMTLVVDPLISLMMDQIDNMGLSQIDAVSSVSSEQSATERSIAMEQLAQRTALIFFISPERLQIPTFRDALRSLCQTTPVPYLVIDEAHCISEWGHDFRPSYLKLADNARKICQYNDFHPSIIALTGTASSVVLSDIQRVVGLDDEAIVTPETYDRPELDFEIQKCDSRQKWSKLKETLLKLPQHFNMSPQSFYEPENGGIIFCPHVGGSLGIAQIAERIHRELKSLIPEVRMYSGKPPKGYAPEEWKQIKIRNQEAFKKNEIPLIVATKAFGMGIDKPNIRYTIHYSMPTSLEAFYQETGRAGRDRSKAICSLIFSGQLLKWKEFFEPNVTAEDLVHQVGAISQWDDIYVMLHFHTNSWRGVEREFRGITGLLASRIHPATQNLQYDESTTISIPFEGETEDDEGEDPRSRTEKILYRLSLLGLVVDYALDHNARVFEVEVARRKDDHFKSVLLEYVCRYKPTEYRDRFSERIKSSEGSTMLEKCLNVLLEFVYEEIEKKRRRTILQMAEVASTSVDKEAFRKALLNYLETSEFTKRLDKISKEILASDWVDIASNIEDISSAQRLLGGCRRALESYPDHPGLLMLSSYARLMTSDETAVDEFERAIKALAAAPLEGVVQEDTLIKILGLVAGERPGIMPTLCYVALTGFPRVGIARVVLVYVNTSSNAGTLSLAILLENTLGKVRSVVRHVLGGDLN